MPSADTIRREITEKIVAALESGETPMWRQPWLTHRNAGRAANFVSYRPYSGINVLLLGLHSMQFGHRSRWFGTFDQWKQAGGIVKKRPAHVEPGEWGCRIVFYRPVTKKLTDSQTGEQRDDGFLLLRTYTVFNADQVEGEAVDRFRVTDEPDTYAEAQFEAANELIAATGADIRIGG
jgi:antirestriction protein ArdC